MGKTAIQEKWRVEVWPRRAGDYGFASMSGQAWTADETRRICEGIAAEIRKHVGKFEHDRGDIEVICDERPVCEHCGAGWTEDSDVYNGGCCPEDVDGEPALASPADAINEVRADLAALSPSPSDGGR